MLAKVPSLVSRIRSALQNGWADPTAYYGAVFRGRFDVQGGRVTGFVSHVRDPLPRPPFGIEILRADERVGFTNVFEQHDVGWKFAFDVECKFEPDDILQDRLKAFALDRRGARSQLEFSGATQLEYIKAIYSPAELVVDFKQGGNSLEYVQEGWYRPEGDRTWTRDLHSVVGVPIRAPGSPYRLEIHATPYTLPGKIESQSLTISIDGDVFGSTMVNRGRDMLEFDLPSDVTQMGRITIRFDHPDAARPCDLLPVEDKRVIAFAFRSMKLIKLR